MSRISLLLTFVALACARAPNEHSKISSLKGRIVGGTATTIEEYPYQISLQKDGNHYCGGSLIASNAVLTAAHCVSSSGAFSVRAGTTTRENGGVVADVVEIRIHPQYSGNDYDVAVLRLNQYFTLGPTIQTIPFATSVADDAPVGTLGTVTGWGSLFFLGPSPSKLRVVQLPKVSQSSCETSYPFGQITDRMRCYGYFQGGKDSCQGDSGGPLVIGGKVVGIVSWGVGCAILLIPGVYTNVANPEIYGHIQNSLASFP